MVCPQGLFQRPFNLANGKGRGKSLARRLIERLSDARGELPKLQLGQQIQLPVIGVVWIQCKGFRGAMGRQELAGHVRGKFARDQFLGGLVPIP